jgi:hypothetical protein
VFARYRNRKLSFKRTKRYYRDVLCGVVHLLVLRRFGGASCSKSWARNPSKATWKWALPGEQSDLPGLTLRHETFPPLLEVSGFGHFPSSS